MNQRAIFLDRDGVINRSFFRDGKPRAPQHLHEFEIFPGVKEAVIKFKQEGFMTIVVTNQPDVARGWQKKEVVDSMHQKMFRELALDDLKVCFHDDHHGCPCRKPKPGMLLEAAQFWKINLPRSFMIGDRLSDIEAGNQAGCTSILIEDAENNRKPTPPSLGLFHRAPSLLHAVEIVLREHSK